MRRILCVEDDKDSREVLELILRTAMNGHHVEGAGSARDAMALISSEPYDIYILDLFMPDMDGAQLCRWIRETDVTTPVIFLSAAARNAEKQMAFDAGADEYLVKPYALDQIVEVVKRYLEEPANHNGQLQTVNLNPPPTDTDELPE